MSTMAWSAAAAGAQLEQLPIKLPELGACEVRLRVSHCGICHSDLHLLDGDWGSSQFPLVPGHEVIGEVVATGNAVRQLQVGQVVGVGWQADSCSVCEWCESGEENLCRAHQPTCVGRIGGFAEEIQVNERFAFPLPDSMDAARAAPLFCGGITVFAPLERYMRQGARRVAIAGIGGLGHQALQFARALGAEVTAISHSASKHDEAVALGANNFVVVDDAAGWRQQKREYDLILSTATVSMPWPEMLGALRPNGSLCIVGDPGETLEIPAMRLINGQKQLAGSQIGGRAAMQRMLELAASENIGAKVELMNFDDVNAAFERLRAGKPRYRVVLQR